MSRTSESASSAQQRLRRVEGRHNSLVKELRQAFAHAELTDEGDCAVEGLRIVEEAIRSGLRFKAVFFKESAQNLAERLLPQIGANVSTLVRVKDFSLDDLVERMQIGPILVVVGLQDPGNLGTILRSAEAFGSAGVVLGEGTVSAFNSKVIRASAGSIFRLPVIVAKTAGGLDAISAKLRAQGVRLMATSSHKGTPLDAAKLTGPSAIFVGSEGSGLPRSLLAQLDESIAIPHSANVESLNAGVAGSIVLYEAARQRRER
jgi:TrmH family RNA methyltransferase